MSEKINKNFKGLYDTSKTTFITDRTEPTHFYEPEVKTPRIKNVSYSINFDKKELYKQIEDLQQKVEQLEKENDKLKHKLNDIAFGDDSELALRFLRKIDYVDFDEKRKVYINKHNNEPFLWKDEQEKDYYLKDEELNEYTQQLEYKVEQLENIRKEAIEYINRKKYQPSPLGFELELNPKELCQLQNILNKGSEEK